MTETSVNTLSREFAYPCPKTLTRILYFHLTRFNEEINIVNFFHFLNLLLPCKDWKFEFIDYENLS